MAADACRDYFQNRRADLSVSPWRCPAVPIRQFTPIADIPSRQRLRSSSSDDRLVPGSQTAYCWASRLPCRRRSHMERPNGRRHLGTISAHLQKTTKNASVSTFIPWPTVL